MPGLFVTGTDTEVGKTVVTATIVAALHAAGAAVRPFKPVITGLDERPRPEWPHDHELLAAVGERPLAEVTAYTFGPAVSPHLAAALAGVAIDPEAVVAPVRAWLEAGETVVVEGVGGLLVPILEGYAVRDLAADLGLPVLLVARPGLGTINHTLLSLEAARARDLRIAGVVLTPWPEAPSAMERSNRETIASLGNVPVAQLPYVDAPTPDRLAAAGHLLPIESWLA